MTSVAWTFDSALFYEPQSASAMASDELFQPQSASAMESAEQMKWRAIEDEINSFRSCHDNWDGMGALAADPEVIVRAIIFLRKARTLFGDFAPTRATLGPNGSIAIEWREKSGAKYEAEIDSFPEIHWMFFDGKTRRIHWDWEEPEIPEKTRDQSEIRGGGWRANAITRGDEPDFVSAA